ncbi:MAG: MBL fold metallo-hydrolase [Clostridia bacterium]|nr:MBL fold metallo-hydrolase [Clostridia bacterium]
MMIRLRHTQDHPISVVYPQDGTESVFDMAENLAGLIRDICGIYPTLLCDADMGANQETAAILLGETELAVSVQALRDIGYGECAFYLSADKKSLAVATRTETLLPEAIRNLTETMTWHQGELLLQDRLMSRHIYSIGMLRHVPPVCAGKRVQTRRSLDLCDQIVIEGITQRDWEDYQSALLEARFKKKYENKIGGNSFFRYEKEECSLYVYYTSFNRTMRLLAEPVRNVHMDRKRNGSSIVTPLMTVIGGRFSTESRYLNCDAGSGNMGYVFRLEDGRFVLVDGGMDSGNYAENIYRTLSEQSPEPSNIVIACWFLSHTHIDHTGAFMTMAEKYADRITVEEIASNFPSMADAACFREAWNTRRIKEHIHRYFPDAKYSKVHTGQKLSFTGAEVEILYTQDDLVRKSLSLANETLNTASICMRITIGGNTIMLPADCDETANHILLNMYGDYLKSDILQVCHHGGWGGTTEFYASVDPEVAIFSTSDELYSKYLQIRYNHDLVYDMHVQEAYNNAERCRVFTLPYHPAHKNLPEDPKEDCLYTEAKQLEALASLENLKKKNAVMQQK